MTSRRCGCGAVDREVDGVAPRGADEAREGAADEEEERADVHRVAHPGGEEAVQADGTRPITSATIHATSDGEESEDRPQQEPDEVREREQEPEEDRQPRALERSVELEPDGMRRKRGERQHPARDPSSDSDP